MSARNTMVDRAGVCCAHGVRLHVGTVLALCGPCMSTAAAC